MIGGIYCEVPFFNVYDKSVASSARKRAKELLGYDVKFLSTEVLDFHIRAKLFELGKDGLSRRMSRIPRGYENRTVDLMRSTGMAVFHDGVLQEDYTHQYSGGQTESSEKPTKHKEGPETRFYRFIRQYECLYNKGFTVVFAATMPYAVRMEMDGFRFVTTPHGTFGGYAASVLKLGINDIIGKLVNSRNPKIKSPVKYGYIFESSGQREEKTI